MRFGPTQQHIRSFSKGFNSTAKKKASQKLTGFFSEDNASTPRSPLEDEAVEDKLKQRHFSEFTFTDLENRR